MAIGYGIDFGTSTSAIIVVDAEGTVTRISDPESAHTSYTFPSSAFVNAQGDLLVGTAAERQKRLDLSAFRTEFKREFRSTVPNQLGNRSLRTDELVTALLKRLRECALDRIPGPAQQVVITIPASWDEVQRRRMTDAAAAAGFDPATVVLLPEPVAALRYAFDRDLLIAETTVLVYDLGGGTFDCVLARGNTAEGYAVVGRPGGCPDIGGIDFTTALMKKVAHDLEPPRPDWLEIDPDDDQASRMYLSFRDECESAKRVLSTQASAWLHLPEGDPVEVDQATLEDSIGQMLEETIASCEQLLRTADLTWEDIGQVVPVGGSTRLTLIAKLLRDSANRVVKVAEPELAVALGAALHAKDLINGVEDRFSEEEAPVEIGEAAEESATHSTVPLPGAAERPAPETPYPPPAYPSRLSAMTSSASPAKVAGAMLAGLAAMAGILKLGLLSYAGLAALLDDHAWEWVPSGWVAGIAGTVCMLAVVLVATLVYVYIIEERDGDLVSPWITLAFMATVGAVVWHHAAGWDDAAIPVSVLVNVAVIAYAVAAEHASYLDWGLGDAMEETWAALFAVGGVALFTWWSAAAYGRLAAYLEPRWWDFWATGWIGGLVGTLAAAAAVAIAVLCIFVMDENVAEDHQQGFVLLCMVLTAAATIVAYNVPGGLGVAITFAVANLAAASFLIASTD
jgi:hypothetical protein